MEKSDILSVRIDPNYCTFVTEESQSKVIPNDILIEKSATSNSVWEYWTKSKKLIIIFEPQVPKDLKRILTNALSMSLLDFKIVETEQAKSFSFRVDTLTVASSSRPPVTGTEGSLDGVYPEHCRGTRDDRYLDALRQGASFCEAFPSPKKGGYFCIEVDASGFGSIYYAIGESRYEVASIDSLKVWNEYLDSTATYCQSNDNAQMRMNIIIKDVAKQWILSSDKTSQETCKETGVFLKIPKNLNNEYFVQGLEREIRLPIIIV